jgi:PIN domain nuclease of toxin-antitoxin system
MLPRLLLDTHVVLRWLIDAKRLSRVQSGVLEAAVQRGGASRSECDYLLEIAALASKES